MQGKLRRRNLLGEVLGDALLIVVVIVVAGLALTAVLWISSFVSAQTMPPVGDAFTVAARAALVNPAVPEWKKDLLTQGLTHRGEGRETSARLVFYHPREACTEETHARRLASGDACKCQKWIGTASGTLVRPGVASCTVSARKAGKWWGSWVWIEGLGLHKVEDVFPESGSHDVFDIAAPWPVSSSYAEWLADRRAVRFAEHVQYRGRAVVTVKPRGGWSQ